MKMFKDEERSVIYEYPQSNIVIALRNRSGCQTLKSGWDVTIWGSLEGVSFDDGSVLVPDDDSSHCTPGRIS